MVHQFGTTLKTYTFKLMSETPKEQKNIEKNVLYLLVKICIDKKKNEVIKQVHT